MNHTKAAHTKYTPPMPTAVMRHLERRSAAPEELQLGAPPEWCAPSCAPPEWCAPSCAPAECAACSASKASASASQGGWVRVTHALKLYHRLSAVSLLGASTLRQYQRTKRRGWPSGPV